MIFDPPLTWEQWVRWRNDAMFAAYRAMPDWARRKMPAAEPVAAPKVPAPAAQAKLRLRRGNE